MLQSELQTYSALLHLQGHFIPIDRVYGFYNIIWGILDILALEPVGEAVSEDEKITPAFYGTYPTQLLHQHTTVCL